MNNQFFSYVCLILSLVCVQYATAQQDFYGGYTPAATAAPTAAQTTKASSATVDLTTGAAQYAVPIYTIKQNGISWGVGLQYRYTGLRVLEEPSNIGLGWSLAATGMVSREVRGLPDDHPKGYHGSENIRQTILDPYYYFDANNSPQTNGKKVLKEHDAYRLANGLIDGEPDLFTVSAGRLNFSFKIGRDGTPVLMSHHNVKVSFSWDRIEVIDSEGVTYVFAAKEIFSPIPERELETVHNGNTLHPPIEPHYAYTRSWYLTAIIPKNTTQQITFEYQNHIEKKKEFVPKIYSYKGKQSEFLYNIGTGSFAPYEGGPQVTSNALSSTIDRLQASIPNPNVQQELSPHIDPYIYTHIRLDVDITVPVLQKINFTEGTLHFNTLAVGSGNPHRYTSVALKDFNNKHVHIYDWTTQGNRHLLTQIRMDNEVAYGFEYYHQDDAEGIPDFEYNNEEVSARMDEWGYYKGSKSTTNQITSSASQAASLESTQSGALKTIKYKTGGTTSIEYELNATPLKSSYGGLRVFSVQNCPGANQACTEKRYEYMADKLVSSGREISWEGNPKNKSIFYSQVTQYNVYHEGTTLVKNGKTVYTFHNPDNFRPSAIPEDDEYNLPSRGLVEGGGRMKKVRTYKTDISGVSYKDQLISEQQYEYEMVPAQADAEGNSTDANYPYGIKVRPTTGIKREWQIDQQVVKRMGDFELNNPTIGLFLVEFNDHYVNGTQAAFEAYGADLIARARVNPNTLLWKELEKYTYGVGEMGTGEENAHYKIATYKETNFVPRQKRVISKTYSDMHPDDFSESTQEFAYDTYNQVERQTQTDSKGISKSARYYYPYHTEINNTQLLGSHRIASPVKTETFIGDQKQGTAVVNFNNWQNNYYMPSTIQAAKEGAAMRDQTIYHKYDTKGNPLEVSSGKGPHTVYIWGYNDIYPVAKVGNATYTEIASYVAELKAKSNADTDRTRGYTGKEGALRQAQDALRAALPNALVTTYTYDPLIGITSTTDPRGYTVYHEYDALGRLQLNRDAEGNITNKYYYDYAKTETSQNYAPLEASMTTFPAYGIVNEAQNFAASVQGGSGTYDYTWEFEAPNGTITTIRSLSFPHTFSSVQKGNMTIRFKVTDKVTGNTKSLKRALPVYGAYSVALQYPNPIKVNTSATFNVAIQGGSGNFSYAWTIYGRSSHYSSTKKSFNLTMGFNYYGNNRNLRCIITDRVTGRSFTLNKQYTVNQAVLNQSWTRTFRDVNSSYHNERYRTTASGGSGQYTYAWTSSDGRSTSSRDFSIYMNQCRQSEYIKCTVTDRITGLRRTVNKDFYFFPSRCNNSGGGGGLGDGLPNPGDPQQ